MDYHKLEKRIEEHVTDMFEQLETDVLRFHNLEHTRDVVRHTREIAAHYNLSDKELFIVIAAAWFHDTGHLVTDPGKHEEMSCDILRKYLKDHLDNEKTTQEIADCIMATKFPRNPQGLLQDILCDADTYHLGTRDFKDCNKRVFEETKLRNGETDPVKFTEDTIRLLKTHQYYTSYCKEILDGKKRKNLKKLEAKLKGDSSAEIADPADLSNVHKDKTGLMSKGIQTMLRLTSQNHLKLSEMADHKANILISVNAIIISVILSVLLRRLSEDTYLIVPTIIFLLVAVITIVISILSTRPKINSGSFTLEDVKQKKINLLFFGNFYKTTYEQYNAAMREMMLDTDYLYGSLIKDIYYLGEVLGKKYRLIRLAYNIFMIGIIISVIAFTIASVFYGGSQSGTVINGTGSPL